MLNASFASPFSVPVGSRDSPSMRTQPRLMPPAAGVWMEKDCLCGVGEEKKDLDLGHD